MTSKYATLRSSLEGLLGEKIKDLSGEGDELTLEVDRESLQEVAISLRDEAALRFEILVDVCGVDYLHYGEAEWTTDSATGSGYSRGVEPTAVITDYASTFDPRRFAVVYHLLSISKNRRLRVKCFTGSANPPVVPSLIGVWASANWFEREVFDMFGILFDGHSDLRRILTDYGFIGHPFRKDFPLSGDVEVRYDPDKGRVAYQPVSIEPRTLVPKVIRQDNRYEESLKDGPENG